MNLTAITFVTGSMLFAVASIPYLFNLQSSTDQRTVDAFLASQYVVGSVLFLLGGWFNYRRARIVASSQDDAVVASARPRRHHRCPSLTLTRAPGHRAAPCRPGEGSSARCRRRSSAVVPRCQGGQLELAVLSVADLADHGVGDGLELTRVAQRHAGLGGEPHVGGLAAVLVARRGAISVVAVGAHRLATDVERLGADEAVRTLADGGAVDPGAGAGTGLGPLVAGLLVGTDGGGVALERRGGLVGERAEVPALEALPADLVEPTVAGQYRQVCQWLVL